MYHRPNYYFKISINSYLTVGAEYHIQIPLGRREEARPTLRRHFLGRRFYGVTFL